MLLGVPLFVTAGHVAFLHGHPVVQSGVDYCCRLLITFVSVLMGMWGTVTLAARNPKAAAALGLEDLWEICPSWLFW